MTNSIAFWIGFSINFGWILGPTWLQNRSEIDSQSVQKSSQTMMRFWIDFGVNLGSIRGLTTFHERKLLYLMYDLR